MTYKIKFRVNKFKTRIDARNYAIKNKLKNVEYGYNEKEKHFIEYSKKQNDI